MRVTIDGTEVEVEPGTTVLDAARAAGADAFLVKPVSPRALATALLAVRRPSAAAI